MRSLLIAAICVLSFSAFASGFDDEVTINKAGWKSSNHPRILLGQEYEDRLESLPLEATLEGFKDIWSDHYWPRNRGGIAYRWMTRTTPPKYKLYRAHQIPKLTEQEIALLSPAEKLDIIRGNYNFPFTRKVIRENPASVRGWEGICHGWAPAAMNHPAAAPVTVKNPQGLSVPFGASDVHALLSYYYAKFHKQAIILGKRCRFENGSASCRDTNPGAFHLVLTNMIGIRKEPFLADVSAGLSVWNHPVLSYKSTLIEERKPARRAAKGTSREILIHTTVIYVNENIPTWETAPRQKTRREYYQYWLELNEQGKILGGKWKSKTHPDFLWMEDKATFTEQWAVLNELLVQSSPQ